jgi:hypothetical protein
MQGPTILTCLNHYVRECLDTRALHSRNQGSLMRSGVWCPSISLPLCFITWSPRSQCKRKGESETLGGKYISHVSKVSKGCHFVRIVMEPMPTASSRTHMIFNHWLTLTILQLVTFGHPPYLEVILDDPFFKNHTHMAMKNYLNMNPRCLNKWSCHFIRELYWWRKTIMTHS